MVVPRTDASSDKGQAPGIAIHVVAATPQEAGRAALLASTVAPTYLPHHLPAEDAREASCCLPACLPACLSHSVCSCLPVCTYLLAHPPASGRQGGQLHDWERSRQQEQADLRAARPPAGRQV
jgi:hypothetical protein